MSSWPWAATPLRTTRSASGSSWKRKRNRNAKLVCVDPRFNRTAAVADRFVQIRAGTDIAFLGGLIHYALSHNRYHDEYVRLFTNAPFLVHERYAFDETAGSSRAGIPSRRPTPTNRAGNTSSMSAGSPASIRRSSIRGRSSR